MTATREAAAGGERTINLLDHDPSLGASLRPERLDEARGAARVVAITVPQGTWATAHALAGGRTSEYGLLLLDGLVAQAITLDGVAAAELLGPEDLLADGRAQRDALLPTATGWTVLEPATVALLDERFLLTVRRWPELVAALFQRLAAQAGRRAAHRALCQLPRVEDRVHALLWYLAERWGRVAPHGVVLPLHLTHELIGQLVGAKRPTVSLAIKELEERSVVHRRSDGAWLLQQVWNEPSAAPSADGAAATGAGLVPEAPRPVPAPAPKPNRPIGAPEDIHQRIQRMRETHERMRDDIAAATARATAARERSERLREQLDDLRRRPAVQRPARAAPSA
jgi:CRP/FNR family transcriptional regulator, cyclic AMP receptor protein